jgi:hypothetical protein
LSLGATPLAAQSFHTLSSSRQRSGEKELNVKVEFAAGRFHLHRETSGALYRSRLSYNEERFQPLAEYDDGDLHVGLKGLTVKSNVDFEKREYERQSMDLGLSPDVPITLDLTFAAGEAEVDLGGLNLSSAAIKTGATKSQVLFSTPAKGDCENLQFQVGAAEFRAEQLGNSRCRNFDFIGGAGDLTLDFGGDWGKTAAVTADLKVGVGTLRLELPREIGVEVQMTRFLASFANAGLIKRGDDYYSSNWETAKVRLHIDIAAALGNIEVNWR